MDEALPSLSSVSDSLEADSEEFQLRVDFFRKLGYTPSEVMAALRKQGLSTDTNAVLGELVRNRTSSVPCISSSDSDERSTRQNDSLQPPSWGLGSCKNTTQLWDQNKPEEELRPVVIDGSNVAMR